MPNTMQDIRERAYKELFDFINWLARKYPLWWEQIMGEYYDKKR